MSEWLRSRAWFAWGALAGAVVVALLDGPVARPLAVVLGAGAFAIVALFVGEPR